RAAVSVSQCEGVSDAMRDNVRDHPISTLTPIRAESNDGNSGLGRHPRTPFVINDDDGTRNMLRLKKRLLRIEIGVHRAVQVEMVLRQVCKASHGEAQPRDALENHGMR